MTEQLVQTVVPDVSLPRFIQASWILHVEDSLQTTFCVRWLLVRVPMLEGEDIQFSTAEAIERRTQMRAETNNVLSAPRVHSTSPHSSAIHTNMPRHKQSTAIQYHKCIIRTDTLPMTPPRTKNTQPSARSDVTRLVRER